MNFAACFFDFDGVLADSVEVKTEAFRALYLPDGPAVADRVVAHHRDHGGMNRFDKFAVYEREFAGRPFDDARCQELARRFSELVLAGVLAAPPIPGAEEFLRQAAATCPCFVVSATPEPEIRHIVTERALAPLLLEVTGAPTSKTENLGRLLREHHLDPTACVFFGDATSDYDAATACGVRFVGIVPGPDAALVRRHPEVEHHPDFVALAAAWEGQNQAVAPNILEAMRPSRPYEAVLLNRERDGVSFYLREHERFVTVDCPACRTPARPDSLAFRRFGFSFHRCPVCQTLFANPRPREEQLADYYEHFETPRLWTQLLTTTANSRGRIQIRPRLKLLAKVLAQVNNARQTFVDIGAGSGAFASALKEEGLFDRVFAYDISPDCVRRCAEAGLDAHQGSVADLEDASVDGLSCNDLIEHLFSPADFLKLTARKLRPGGIVFVCTPNGLGFDFQLLEERTENIVPPEHIQFFNPGSLARLMEGCGLRPMAITTPGELDVSIIKRHRAAGNLRLDLTNRYLDMLFDYDDPALEQSLQEFLKANLLSSHMLGIAIKP